MERHCKINKSYRLAFCMFLSIFLTFLKPCPCYTKFEGYEMNMIIT